MNHMEFGSTAAYNKQMEERITQFYNPSTKQPKRLFQMNKAEVTPLPVQVVTAPLDAMVEISVPTIVESQAPMLNTERGDAIPVVKHAVMMQCDRNCHARYSAGKQFGDR